MSKPPQVPGGGANSVPHDSASLFVRGAADYVDDRPELRGELHVGVVTSPVAHGILRGIDVNAALGIPGVECVLTAADLAHNRWGTIFQDQPILADTEVNFVGEPVAIVAAETREAMRAARKAVVLKIEARPALLSIEAARAAESFLGSAREILTGDPEQALAESPQRISGMLELAGQDHFYLESQASIAYPDGSGRIEVHSSSQHPTEVQHVVAHALGLKFHEVVCIVKRMGGAFGGKESQAAPFAAMAALVAQRTNRAARLVLTKDEDMVMTGKRNPFHCHYEAGFDGEGRILAFKADLFSDGGAYADLSTAIMERAMLHCDNAYYLPHARIRGQVCKTHYHPHTAFRGFGGPKGVALIENVIEEIALTLGIDALAVRRKNVYQNGRGNITPYGQIVDQDMLPRLFEKLESSSGYAARRREIEAFNRRPGDHFVKGLALTAVKFGISFTTRFLNQGAALVNLHVDGSVQVSTGATEMGQGVNTKIAALVASELGISTEDVRVLPTSTATIHNTSPTAASSGSDINCGAAALACGELKDRLAALALALFDRPLESRGPKVAGAGTASEIVLGTEAKGAASNVNFAGGYVSDAANPAHKIALAELAREAHLHRISLGAYGYFRYPEIHFNKETGKGQPFFYFTNGVAAAEVTIDRATGETKVDRVDILMDLGRPMNQGVDLGQVTGGFVQGMGWVTTEKLHYDKDGRLHSFSPSTYKIPNIQDIPRIFNVELLENSENSKNVRCSKAVGEPPLLLAVSVWCAIKNAVAYANASTIPKLRLPATGEEVLCAIPSP